MRRADNLTTFICRLSWNLRASTSWNPQGLSRPVMGLLYLLPFCDEGLYNTSFLGRRRISHWVLYSLSQTTGWEFALLPAFIFKSWPFWYLSLFWCCGHLHDCLVRHRWSRTSGMLVDFGFILVTVCTVPHSTLHHVHHTSSDSSYRYFPTLCSWPKCGIEVVYSFVVTSLSSSAHPTNPQALAFEWYNSCWLQRRVHGTPFV